MAELKPCFWCGEVFKAMVQVDEELCSLGDQEGYYQVHCYMCGAKGPVREGREKAIDAWNKMSQYGYCVVRTCRLFNFRLQLYFRRFYTGQTVCRIRGEKG